MNTRQRYYNDGSGSAISRLPLARPQPAVALVWHAMPDMSAAQSNQALMAGSQT